MIKMIERTPLHDWRVEELSRRLRISERTLNRAVKDYFGQTTKAFLMALRQQLLDHARELTRLSWEELAQLFGFSSPKELHNWRRDYEARQ